MRPFDDISRLADAPALDRIAQPLRSAGEWLVARRSVADALHGVWLGHPLHPVLVQVPVGAFSSSALLDLVPGARRGADLLLAVGLVSSVPAAAAGLADYVSGHEEQQRVGVVHAAANAVALACYSTSLRRRLGGRRAAGKAWSAAGAAALVVGGTLGGHLSYHLAQGVNHAQGVPHTGPSDWVDLGPVDDLTVREPARRWAGDVPVVAVRTGSGAVHVLADTCTHASAPLHQGTVGRDDGAECLECPWHGSVFRLSDGEVLHGPATAGQPTFDTRLVDDRIQVRVRTWAGVPSAG